MDFAKHQFSQGHAEDGAATPNSCEGKEFCQKLIRVIVSRISTTSQLVLGDLSKHLIKSADVTNDQQTIVYRQYHNRHKQFAYSQFKSVCGNNLTQEVIKQHFSNLK